MKRLKLDLDDLKVESFETTPETTRPEGTVQGYGFTCVNTECGSCDLLTCFEPCGGVTATCHGTCGNTCGATCGGTCANTCLNTCGSTCGNTCGNTCGCTDPDTSWPGCNMSLPC